jgi:membrane protein implicated in regulation of membrane protease activity
LVAKYDFLLSGVVFLFLGIISLVMSDKTISFVWLGLAMFHIVQFILAYNKDRRLPKDEANAKMELTLFYQFLRKRFTFFLAAFIAGLLATFILQYLKNH